jgi:lysozyme family protein
MLPPPMGYHLGTLGAASAAVARLQRGLTLLAMTTGNSALATKDDGLTGPRTAAAVNLAFTRYIKNAPANLRTGRLTPAQVANLASQLSSYVEGAASAKPSAAPRAPAPVATRPAPAPVAKIVKSAATLRLQQAIKTLGVRVNNKALAIGADGVSGPKTAAAVNLAFTKYIPDAPAQLRTGRLTALDVQNLASTMIPLVDREILKRAPKPAAPAAKPATKPAPVPIKIPTPTSKAPSKSAAQAGIVYLQQVINQLGTAAGDKALAIAIDGVVGPNTTKATNRALVTYVKAAPASMRTGKLTAAQVKTNAGKLAQYISQAVAVRGVPPTTPPDTMTPEPLPPEPVPVQQPTSSLAPPTEAGPPPFTPAAATAPSDFQPPSYQPPPSFQPPPSYQPPGEDFQPPSEAAPVVAQKEPFDWKPVLIGGGVLAAAGLAFALLRGGGAGAPVFVPAYASRKRRR